MTRQQLARQWRGILLIKNREYPLFHLLAASLCVTPTPLDSWLRLPSLWSKIDTDPSRILPSLTAIQTHGVDPVLSTLERLDDVPNAIMHAHDRLTGFTVVWWLAVSVLTLTFERRYVTDPCLDQLIADMVHTLNEMQGVYAYE